jgi:hypothetical protein
VGGFKAKQQCRPGRERERRDGLGDRLAGAVEGARRGPRGGVRSLRGAAFLARNLVLLGSNFERLVEWGGPPQRHRGRPVEAAGEQRAGVSALAARGRSAEA